jgi:16S rRNA (cytidine1402-2'-O)-methyltransferase
LKSIDRSIEIDDLHFSELNEHTAEDEIPGLLEPLRKGHDLGLLSEAGLPCIADPGSRLVSLAHMSGFHVRPFPGPSSIYLALMASGFNGQAFVFHGYLPVNKGNRVKKIREMEVDILKNGRTQLFIETPYRNNQLLKSLVDTCKDSILLCVASNLTSSDEMVSVKAIRDWKNTLPDLHKRPAVFLLYH